LGNNIDFLGKAFAHLGNNIDFLGKAIARLDNNIDFLGKAFAHLVELFAFLGNLPALFVGSICNFCEKRQQSRTCSGFAGLSKNQKLIFTKFLTKRRILSKRKGKFYKKQSNEKSKNFILFI